MINRISLSFLVLFLSVSSFAENDVGRLPDGRAYRVDDQGYQLVDYVAELELKIEELQTEIIALSNELKLKESSSSVSDNGFGEKNLYPKNEQKEKVVTKIIKEQVLVPGDCGDYQVEIAACEKKQLASEEFRQVYLRKLKQLESKNENLLAQLNDQRDLLMASSDEGSEYQTKLASMQSNLDNLHSKLNEKDDFINQLQAEKQNTITALNNKDTELEDFRGEQDSEVIQLKSQLQMALSDKNDIQQKLEIALSDKNDIQQKLEIALAKVDNTQVVARSEENKDIPSANPVPLSSPVTSSYVGGSNQREKAFSHLQSRLALDLKKIATMIKERARLSNKYEAVKNSRSVQVSLKPLSTKAGYTMERLSSDLPRAAKFSDLGKIQKNIYELSKNISSDIAVLQRLLK